MGLSPSCRYHLAFILNGLHCDSLWYRLLSPCTEVSDYRKPHSSQAITMANPWASQIDADRDEDHYRRIATVSSARAGEHIQIPRCMSPEHAEFDSQSIFDMTEPPPPFSAVKPAHVSANPFTGSNMSSSKKNIPTSRTKKTASPGVFRTPLPVKPTQHLREVRKPSLLLEYGDEKSQPIVSETPIVGPLFMLFLKQYCNHRVYFYRPISDREKESSHTVNSLNELRIN